MSLIYLLIPAAVAFYVGSQIHWGLGIALAVAAYFGGFWLVAAASAKERARLFAEATAQADGLHSYRRLYTELDIVGESYRQSALRKLWDPATTYDAVMIPEGDNSHDRNAVRVEIAGIHVGYLSRETARVYRGVMGADRCKVPVHLVMGGAIGTIGVFTGKSKADKAAAATIPAASPHSTSASE